MMSLSKNLEIHLHCNNAIINFNSNVKATLDNPEIVFNNNVFSDALRLVFRHINKQIENVKTQSQWKGKLINLVILFDKEKIIDTREKQFKVFQPLFKLPIKGKSKGKYAKLLFYLINESQILTKFTDYNDIQNYNITKILESINNENNPLELNIYTDYQIALLCQGMLEFKPRDLANQYFKTNNWNTQEKEQANAYLRSCIKKYGINFIDYCLKLPRKPFKLSNCSRMFSQFDRKQKTNQLSIRIALKDMVLELSRENSKIDEIKIINSKNTQIGSIKRSGDVSLKQNATNYNSTLSLLIAFASNPLKQIIYYGNHIGNCSFCNLPLTDPISLNLGYGKTCANNYGLVWH